MKKTLTIFSTALFCLLFCLSCNGESVDFMLHNLTAEKTVFYASKDFSRLTELAVKDTGYKTTTNTEETPDLFVIKGDDLSSLSENLTILAEKTLLAGKALLIESPTYAQLDAFYERIKDYLDSDHGEGGAYEYLYSQDMLSGYTLRELLSVYGNESGDNSDYTESSNEHIFDAIGMREGHIYFVHDIDQVITSDSLLNHSKVEAGSKKYEEDKDGNQTQAEEKTELSSDETGENWNKITSIIAEHFAKWLKGEDKNNVTETEKRAVLKALNSESATEALENAKKAKSVTFSYIIVFNGKADKYDGRYNGKKEVVTTYMDVWTACDISTQKEYYLVRTSALCNNQQLNFTNNWGNGDAYSDLCAGPYFDSFSVSLKLPNGSLEATSCSPQNASGSTSFTTGSGFNIGANVGFGSSGPSGGVSTGFSFSKSSTTSIPDIAVTFTPETENVTAKWKFAAPSLTLERDDWWFFNGVHILHGPKSIQTEAATFDTYTLFTRNSNSDNSKNIAMFEINESITLSCIKAWNTGSGCKAWVFPTFSKWTRHHVPFTRPSNVSCEYIMNVTCPENSSEAHKTMVNQALKEYFSDWASQVTYYTYFGNNSSNNSNADEGKYPVLNTVATNNFASVKQKITANKNVLKDRGFSGTYTFYIQNVDKGTQIQSFSLTF